jgi:hypothetical protein
MPGLRLLLAGEQADAAARELEAAVPDEHKAGLHRSAPEALPEAERKAVDPISLAALVLSIPSAVLAVMDLADRITKRRRAKALIETATRLRVERKVETYVVTAEGPQPLGDMVPDALLELVSRGE